MNPQFQNLATAFLILGKDPKASIMNPTPYLWEARSEVTEPNDINTLLTLHWVRSEHSANLWYFEVK